MSGFPILDVAIGLAFVYLLLALICTTVTEWWAQVRNLRGEMLEQATGRLLGEGPGGPVTTAYLDHPLIKALRTGDRKPSYVAGPVFAKALRAVLARNANVAADPSQAGVHATSRPVHRSPELQEALGALKGDVGAQAALGGDNLPTEAALAEWYEQVMERLSGTYKRKARSLVLVVAIGVTLLMNAETVTLGQTLWQNPTLRAYVVERARARLEQGPPLETVEYTDPDNPTPTPPVAADTSRNPNQLLEEEQALLGELFGWSGVPAGWRSHQARWGDVLGGAFWIVRHLIGWTVTALAVSLGAPFWFDTLNRFMSLRATGRVTPKPAGGAK